MSETKHTPTPWTPDKYGSLRSPDGKEISVKGLGLAMIMGGGDHPEERANAALIIEAVNNYHTLTTQRDMLVKALEFAMPYLEAGVKAAVADARRKMFGEDICTSVYMDEERAQKALLRAQSALSALQQKEGV